MNTTAFRMAVAAGVTSILMAGQALAVPVFSSTDAIWGGQSDGTSFSIGTTVGDTRANNWPGNESPEMAINGLGQKYLNFGKENSGLVISASDSFIVDSLQLWTANDFSDRDPASYALYGTNASLRGSSGDTFAMNAFDLIASGDLALPGDRNAGGTTALSDAASETVSFANFSAFNTYMILFPTLKNSVNSVAVQIAEVQLFGTRFSPELQQREAAEISDSQISAVPLPAAGLLLMGGLFALGFARRRA